ncbi:hypothetical protein MVEN_01978100 [Mycena venus]|uniref:Uncharacterized protein n=1 Tax=Mycena venus TaxID=2733690 RepID=A0A8H6XEK4_9AGAR|nr:hypothetical protein MVEN_01978100 [Mycena venus]
MQFISSLNQLHSIRALIFNEEKEVITIYPRRPRNTLIALHRELEPGHRLVSVSHPEPGVAPPMPDWATERLAVLHREVGATADMTAAEIARGPKLLLPSAARARAAPRCHPRVGAVCVDEADAAGTGSVPVSPERATTMEMLSDALKLIGYAWPPPLDLVGRLDGYAEAHRPALSANDFHEDSTIFLGVNMSVPFDDD